jgi:hypothetical protein
MKIRDACAPERPPVTCPSCGSGIEDSPACCYCGSATLPDRRVSEVRLALCSVPAFLAAAVLLALAAGSQTRVTRIADLTPDGAFDHFRVAGTVTAVKLFPSRYPASGQYTVWVSDGTDPGEDGRGLKVKIEGEVFSEIQGAGRLPEAGDEIDVEGTLHVGEGFKTLSVNTAPMVRTVKKRGEVR